jgi:Putative polyhydroxyalkanoic acid system protein (PHA_gran_rgn)
MTREFPMSDINLTFKHGLTEEEAKARLGEVVTQTQKQFGSMVRQVKWNADRNAVHLSGTGFEVDAWVDTQEVHLVGDIPLLGRLLGGPIGSGLKQIVHQAFQKRLK